MAHLYEMTGQLIGLQRLIEDGEMDEQTLADTLDGLQGDIKVKAEGLLMYVANIGSDVDSIDNEIKRLTARKRVMVNHQNALREYLRYNMDVGGIQKIECPLFTITLKKPAPMVVIDDESALPEKYIMTVVTKSPVKADIMKALKAGKDVPGAHLGESQPGLMIK